MDVNFDKAAEWNRPVVFHSLDFAYGWELTKVVVYEDEIEEGNDKSPIQDSNSALQRVFSSMLSVKNHPLATIVC